MSILDYIVHSMETIWDLLSMITPFSDGYHDSPLGAVFFRVPMFTLIVAFSCISLALDYFNHDNDNDDK